ncbi:hypothetical protein PG990_006505 [Apiospora arundinis]
MRETDFLYLSSPILSSWHGIHERPIGYVYYLARVLNMLPAHAVVPLPVLLRDRHVGHILYEREYPGKAEGGRARTGSWIDLHTHYWPVPTIAWLSSIVSSPEDPANYVHVSITHPATRARSDPEGFSSSGFLWSVTTEVFLQPAHPTCTQPHQTRRSFLSSGGPISILGTLSTRIYST